MPIHLFVQSRQDRAEVDKDLIRAWVAGLLEQVDEPQTFDARLHDLLRTPCSEEQATGAACFIPGMGERYGMPLPALRLIAAELAKWGQRRPPQVFALVERLWRNGLRDERGRAAKMLECLSKHEWAETLELATSFVGDVRNWEECEQLACFGLRNVVQRYPEAMLSCCKAWGQDEDKWMRRFGVAILTSLPKDKGYRLSEREFAIFGCSDGRRSAGGEEHSRLGAAGDRQAAPPAARAAAPFCGRPAPGFDKLPFDQGLICRYNSLKLATSFSHQRLG